MELRHLRYFVGGGGGAALRARRRAPEHLGADADPADPGAGARPRRPAVSAHQALGRPDRGRAAVSRQARATLRQAEQAAQVATAGGARRDRSHRDRLCHLGELPRPDLRRHRGLSPMKHPLVELRLHRMETVRQLNALAQGQIDLGFLRPPLRYPSGLTGATIWKQPFIIAMPAGSSARRREPHPHRLARRRAADRLQRRARARLRRADPGDRRGGQVHAEDRRPRAGHSDDPDPGRGRRRLRLRRRHRSAESPCRVWPIAISPGPPRHALLAAARRRDDAAPAVKAFARMLRTILHQKSGEAPLS